MHYNYPMSDQPMSKLSPWSKWRSYDNLHTYTYRCYSDEGQKYLGNRLVFKAKVKKL